MQGGERGAEQAGRLWGNAGLSPAQTFLPGSTGCYVTRVLTAHRHPLGTAGMCALRPQPSPARRDTGPGFYTLGGWMPRRIPEPESSPWPALPTSAAVLLAFGIMSPVQSLDFPCPQPEGELVPCCWPALALQICLLAEDPGAKPTAVNHRGLSLHLSSHFQQGRFL